MSKSKRLLSKVVNRPAAHQLLIYKHKIAQSSVKVSIESHLKIVISVSVVVVQGESIRKYNL